MLGLHATLGYTSDYDKTMSQPISGSLEAQSNVSGHCLTGVAGEDLPQWALGVGRYKGNFYCWMCDCPHRTDRCKYVIDYCEESGHFRVGSQLILSPTTNMDTFIKQKPKRERPKETRMCSKEYKVSVRSPIGI